MSSSDSNGGKPGEAQKVFSRVRRSEWNEQEHAKLNAVFRDMSRQINTPIYNFKIMVDGPA